ncbi:MAG: hypothetical protein AAFO79_06955, partial [Pseudomonadota bacterium]
ATLAQRGADRASQADAFFENAGTLQSPQLPAAGSDIAAGANRTGLVPARTGTASPAASASTARATGGPALPVSKAAAQPKTPEEANGLLAVAKARLAALQEVVKQTKQAFAQRQYAALPATARTPALDALIAQHGELAALRKQLEVTLLDRHPRMRELREREAALDSQLVEAGRLVEVQLGQRVAQSKAQVSKFERIVKQLKTRTSGEIEDTVRTVQVNALDTEIATKGSLLETYQARLAELQAQSQSETAPVYAEVVQPAVVAAEAVFPRVWPLTGLITAIALVCALLALFVRAALSAGRERRARSVAQSEVRSEAPTAAHSAVTQARRGATGLTPAHAFEPLAPQTLSAEHGGAETANALEQRVTTGAPEPARLAARLRAAAHLATEMPGDTLDTRAASVRQADRTPTERYAEVPARLPANAAGRRAGRRVILRKSKTPF